MTYICFNKKIWILLFISPITESRQVLPFLTETRQEHRRKATRRKKEQDNEDH